MDIIVGVVDNIINRKVTSSKTGKTFPVYVAVMEDGSEIDLGFKDQGLKKGDNVSMNVEKKYGKWNMVSYSPATAGSGSTTVASSKPAPRPSTGRAPFPTPNDSGELAIIRQNALTNAVSAVSNWHHHLDESGKTFTLSMDDYLETIIRTAYKFAEFSSGHREIRVAKSLSAGIKDE